MRYPALLANLIDQTFKEYWDTTFYAPQFRVSIQRNNTILKRNPEKQTIVYELEYYGFDDFKTDINKGTRNTPIEYRTKIFLVKGRCPGLFISL